MQGGERRNKGVVVWTRHAGLAVNRDVVQRQDNTAGNCRVSVDLIFYIITKSNLIIVLSLAVDYSLSTGLIKNASICVTHN